MARRKQETLLAEERVRSGGRPPRPFSLAGLTAVGVLAAAVVFGVAGGELLLGHVLVSFSADLLRQAIDNVAQPVGYLEIRQRAGDQGTMVTLVARGDATLAADAKQHMAPLAGTRWQLLFAPPAEELSELTWRNGLLWLVFAAGFLFLALILYGMYRVLSRALQADLETLIDVVRDARAGQPPQAEYPLHLKEFRGTCRTESAQERGTPRRPPATAGRCAKSVR